ncbi:hypothetical protein B0A48_05893 [Cryoendolithus antarcticus]|uniref:Dienelactone hydrolase domain-containing protein n=1 Tax=Cryoendolithus antarcticus TaxID=1507870 RepID=A0A1V8TCR3_9PEZI|nr:hypothetical protein B0A48_05893 [Cryoendolithus antarcticus]
MERTVGGLPCYVAEPEDNATTKTVIFLVDIFGWKLPNTRLLADSYARAGFTAYIPDVHDGDSLPASFLQTVEPQLPEREKQTVLEKTAATAQVGATLGPWLIKHREGVSRPIIENFIAQVRLIPGTDKVGVIGFCWGGRYAILAGQHPLSGPGSENKGVDAVFAAHPSLVSIPADFDAVNVPLALALGDKDSLLGEADVAKIREVMEKKRSGNEGARKCESEVKVYEGQVHGFALRGDFSDEGGKKAMDEAEKQGIEWFKKYLS